MQFKINEGRDILARTPQALSALLSDLPGNFALKNEGPDTWSPFDVVGHLIHGELTDWIPRTHLILEQGPEAAFEPFDRFAQFEASKGKSLNQLLQEFSELRQKNLADFDDLDLTNEKLELKGRHPEFGSVTLKQMLAAWVVHDLGHIGQIVRVMAKQYKDEAGPWSAYLRVLD
jgi:uncharacterized damage-inducible protein DinB